jgi:hypothetical protein
LVTYNDTPENVGYLAALFGFEPIVAKAWLRLEGQSVANPTNPLNIRDSLELTGYITTPTGKYGYFEDALRGLYSAKQLITRNKASYGYQAILDSAFTRDPFRQAKAIEASGWAAGHYGADWPNNKGGSITAYVKGQSVLTINTLGLKPTQTLTVPPDTEILDGIGKVLTKLTVPATYPYLGTTEDGWAAVVTSGGAVRFVRAGAPFSPTAVDPCAPAVQAAVADAQAQVTAAQAETAAVKQALADLNTGIDRAQGQA